MSRGAPPLPRAEGAARPDANPRRQPRPEAGRRKAGPPLSISDADLLRSARALAADVVRWRRDLHACPELGYEERETTEYLARALTDMGLMPVRRTPTGVWVDIDGAGAAAGRVLVRSDIDGLPVVEDTGLAFAPPAPGRMHACGHDAHMAMALAATRILLERRQSLPGPLRVLFQPAEEGGGGARQMIEAGVLEGVSAAAGQHVFARMPEGPFPGGRAAVGEGPVMAASDRVTITVRGRGGHGSMPHLSVDTIPIAAQVVTALQQVVSRQLNPQRPAVLTFGFIHGGFAPSVIAPETVLEGTIRTFDENTRAALRARVTAVAEGTAHALGASAEVVHADGYPAVVNDAAAARAAREAATAVLGPEALMPFDPLMASEDFSYYAQAVPSVFIMLGAGNPAAGADWANHDPHFTVEEAALPAGAALLAATALRLFAL
jgi:amidohydrolase